MDTNFCVELVFLSHVFFSLPSVHVRKTFILDMLMSPDISNSLLLLLDIENIIFWKTTGNDDEKI